MYSTCVQYYSLVPSLLPPAICNGAEDCLCLEPKTLHSSSLAFGQSAHWNLHTSLTSLQLSLMGTLRTHLQMCIVVVFVRNVSCLIHLCLPHHGLPKTHFPHGQCDRSLVGLQPNLRHSTSVNASLWRLKSYFARGMHADQPRTIDPLFYWLAP